MNWTELEQHFSPARVGRYRVARQGDVTRAASDYSYNLRLAEAMMPMLNVLEIALRNGIHRRLSIVYGRTDWWSAWIGNPVFRWQNQEIANAILKLQKRKEAQTPDKVIAELTFGFWNSLFNTQFQQVLWKDLRLVFTRIPKQQRQRHNVSTALNQVRELRNRVFHHEPLLWLTPTLLDQHAIGVAVINWIDPVIGLWLLNHDRLPAEWNNWLAS